VERSGIHERRIARDGESTCSMATEAARKAMDRASVTAGEVDAIILSTASPDRLLPSTAVDVQAALGATRAAAFDISAACSGWIYGLTVAEGLLSAGSAETVVVIGSEKMSAILDWTDRSTCVLFGDGAGAAVVKRAKQHRGFCRRSCAVTAHWPICCTGRTAGRARRSRNKSCATARTSYTCRGARCSSTRSARWPKRRTARSMGHG